jgi:DtxR family Mn-dependent transcriptional regulator
MTPEETEALSARLGHPFHDPHGDPIPAADGAILPPAGVPLSTLPAGTVAVVTHVEDEPRRVYESLIASEIVAGARIELLGSGPEGIRLRVGGREQLLEPVVAANVAARPMADAAPEEDVRRLSSLERGRTARVVRIAAACQGPQRRRLLDLGVVPGTRVLAALESTSGDPVAYEIRGALIALRRSQADLILIRSENGGDRG